MVYSRTLQTESGSQTLSFQASGRLWHDALVMYDRETKSLWTQHDGRALVGDAAESSRQLVSVPSERTTFASAAARYPNARVLKKKAGVLGKGMATIYDEYSQNQSRLGIFGTELSDARLDGKDLVFGISEAGEDRAFFMYALVSEGSVTIDSAVGPLLVVPVPGGLDARAWKVPEGTQRQGEELVAPDGRRWDLRSGVGQGEPLEGIPGVTQYWFAWLNFHAQTWLWGAPGR